MNVIIDEFIRISFIMSGIILVFISYHATDKVNFYGSNTYRSSPNDGSGSLGNGYHKTSSDFSSGGFGDGGGDGGS